MIDLEGTIRQLAASAEAIRVLVEAVAEVQAEWQPDPKSWSLKEVMRHLYSEESTDFRRHLRELWHEPPILWGKLAVERHPPTRDCRQALEGFLDERAASLEWLRSLEAPDWAAAQQVAFGSSEVITLSAGDVMVSWVAHDYLHIRQINELLYAWHKRQAEPHSVRYAGAW